jgi:hypothetical protein
MHSEVCLSSRQATEPRHRPQFSPQDRHAYEHLSFSLYGHIENC